MPSYVTLDMLYNELKSLHRDVEVVKHALIPIEKITESERNEMDVRLSEMKAGKRRKLEDVIADL